MPPDPIELPPALDPSHEPLLACDLEPLLARLDAMERHVVALEQPPPYRPGLKRMLDPHIAASMPVVDVYPTLNPANLGLVPPEQMLLRIGTLEGTVAALCGQLAETKQWCEESVGRIAALERLAVAQAQPLRAETERADAPSSDHLHGVSERAIRYLDQRIGLLCGQLQATEKWCEESSTQIQDLTTALAGTREILARQVERELATSCIVADKARQQEALAARVAALERPQQPADWLPKPRPDS